MWWLGRLSTRWVVLSGGVSSVLPLVLGVGGVCVVAGRMSPLLEAVEVVGRRARTLDEWMACVGAVLDRRAKSLPGENSLGLVVRRFFRGGAVSSPVLGGGPACGLGGLSGLRFLKLTLQ